MVRTGRTVNILLGQGDESLSNLLGGGRGTAGDVVSGGSGYGARIYATVKDKMIAAQAARSGGTGGGTGGGSYGGGGGRQPDNPTGPLNPV